MNERQLVVLDEDGNEVLCNILFTFTSERTGKNVVVFYPQEDSDEEEIELSAAFYVEKENGEGELEPIESDEDFEEVEEAIQQFEEEMEHCGCGCHCGEHECGPECDCGCQEGEPCTCHCECGPDCDCGCQEGEPCTCHGECHCGCHEE